MKCKNCGAEIPVNAKFCEFCGSAITVQMQKEQEQLNKAGCPKCGSTNITFDREKQAEFKGKDGTTIVRSTVGICKDCGYTWQSESNISAPKKRKTWLWVLGWIFIFPLPLTILLLRKKDMKPALKYGLIALAWVVYAILVITSGSKDKNTTVIKTPTGTSGVISKDTSPKPQTTPAPAAASADGQVRIYPGEVLDNGILQIEYVSVEDYTDYYSWAAPDEGNKIVMLRLKCLNVSDRSRFISSYSFYCFADNEAVDRYALADDLLSATISPGRAASGVVCFEVPEDASSIEVEYEVDTRTGEKAIFVVK